MENFCLGCGIDLASLVKERRNLGSDSKGCPETETRECVPSVWSSLMSEVSRNQGASSLPRSSSNAAIKELASGYRCGQMTSTYLVIARQ